MEDDHLDLGRVASSDRAVTAPFAPRPSARLAAVAALLALAGCAELGQLASAAIRKPTLTFEAATLEGLDLEGVTLGFRYRLDNPNAIGLELARLGYALDVEGRHVVDGQVKNGVRIPANGSVPVTFPVRLRFADVPGFASLVGARDSVAYRLTGTAGIQTPVGVLDVPLSYSGQVPVPRLPGFHLAGLEVRSVSFSDVALEVKLEIANPNRFPLPAGRLDYGVQVGGHEVVRADGRGVSTVAPGGREVVSIPVRLSLASAGRAAAGVAQGGPVDVAVKGQASFGGVPIPLDLRARLPAGP
jgi:LEA14-like dessication related protein